MIYHAARKLGTVFTGTGSCSGPLHYYRQNEEAESEVLLITKRSRSTFTLLPAE